MTKPKVLISDKMDPNAARIFEQQGCDVDVITGQTPDELKAIIGQYDGLATLQTHFSDVLTCLQYRTDFADVMKRIKQAGYARRSECLRIRHAARRRDYAPLSVVKQFIQRHGIRTQIQW